MKWLSSITAVIAFGFLAGCATLNQSDRYLLQEHHVSPSLYDRMVHKDYLPLSDIIALSQHQVPPPFIVNYLWSTDAVYHLSSADVSYLRKAGVSKEVIDYLKGTEAMYAPRYYRYPGPYPYDPYYYPYAGYPYGYYGYGYPTVIVGGGYGYGYRGGYDGYGRHWH